MLYNFKQLGEKVETKAMSSLSSIDFGSQRNGIIANDFEDLLVPLDDFASLRKASVHNVDADSITLGRYHADGRSYITEAKNSNSSYFELGDNWGRIQEKYTLTNDEMFEYLNIPVLDDAVASGKQIRFSHKPELDIYEEPYLASEWKYLKENHGFIDLFKKGDA